MKLMNTTGTSIHGYDALKAKGKDSQIISGFDRRITLSGSPIREDATTAFFALKEMLNYCSQKVSDEKIIEVLNSFPGVRRRFERVSDCFYSDYAHHPEEVKATIDIAKEESQKLGKKGVVVVYQPHQNTRQHEFRDLYKDAFDKADKTRKLNVPIVSIFLLVIGSYHVFIETLFMEKSRKYE